MKNFIIFILLNFTILSCSSETKFSIKKTAELKFDIGFKPNHMFSGCLSNEKGEDFFYFGELTSAKKIKFFTDKGDSLFTISLKNTLSEIGEINDVYVISLDSIVLLTNYTNQLYLVNKKGTIIANKDLSYTIGNKKELYSSIFHSFGMSKNNLLFRQSHLTDGVDSVTSNYQDLKNYYNINQTLPRFVEFRNVFSNKKLVVKEHLPNFLRKFCKENSFTFDFDYHALSKDRLFISSWYSDKIFIYNVEKQKIEKELVVKINHGKIGSKPYQMNDSKYNFEAITKQVNQAGRFSAVINRFFYDEANNLLYVLVFHEQKDLNSEINGNARPWTLNVYNKNYDLVSSKTFDHKSYSMGLTICTKKGLYVQQQEDINKKNKNYVKTFHLYQNI
jgi:hypothetical protein